MSTPTPPVGAASGAAAFDALCSLLIDGGEYYLAPQVGRTRSTDWVAHIYSHHAKDSRTLLASGSGDTMDAACAACAANYHELRTIEDRKAELMQNPDVVEALRLFQVQGIPQAPAQ